MALELSICIPVYNRDIRALVEALLAQDLPQHRAQIVILEDGSTPEKRAGNQWLHEQASVHYQVMEKNVGRAAIRNRLAEMADTPYLLFLDDDSQVIRPHFLETYLKELQPERVICGGREYPELCPDPEYRLHWHYGRWRESQPPRIRQKKAFASFHSNNFVIPRALWSQMPFDESLTQYGHEDSLMGLRLQKAGVALLHLDNPVLHAQLDDNEAFLTKSLQAVENLYALHLRGERGLARNVKLLRLFLQLRRSRLSILWAAWYRQRSTAWRKRLLTADPPSLRLYNLYRLGYLCQLAHSR